MSQGGGGGGGRKSGHNGVPFTGRQEFSPQINTAPVH